jgi:hypothetical protein
MTDPRQFLVADPDPVRGMGSLLRSALPVLGRQNGDARLLLYLERKTKESR